MSQPDFRRPIHDPRTASRVFSGEAVVITPAENVVRMFNPVGSRIWQYADGTRSNEDIAVLLTQEFEVSLEQARASVAAFVDDLATRGLLEYV